MTDYSPHGPLGAGSAPLGDLGTAVPEEAAIACLQAAWGRRAFATTIPRRITAQDWLNTGWAMRWRDRSRDDYTLSTKVGRLLRASPDTREMSQGFLHALPFRRTFDYTAAGDDPLPRGQPPAHGAEPFPYRLGPHDCAEDWHGTAWKDRFTEAMVGAAQVLTAMRDRGEIRAWGMGLNLVEPALLCLEAARPDIFLIAGRYTLLDHTALGRLFPVCAAKGVKIVLGGPYNSGLLAGGTTFNYEPAKADMVARANAIRGICERHGTDIKAAALQFCAAHPVVAAVIPGPRTAAEVQQNAALMQAEFPAPFRRVAPYRSAAGERTDAGKMIRVDAHHHVWTIARGDYGWMSPELSIARDYGLDDLRPQLGDITATVLVQAADTEAETAFMLDVSRASAGLVRGVVGWTDLAAPGAPLRIAKLAADPLMKGLRPMLQDIEDTTWILLPAVQPALEAMARNGLRFDALLKPRHLPVIGKLRSASPQLASGDRPRR